ncbi:MAG TPA: aspartate kinase [Nitrospinota bacterium]|nr:aspartate kinase [Nitrospinota bacterium]
MGLIVQKYGGTSVGSIDRIKEVAKKIVSSKKNGVDVVVVASAMGGETDKLLKMAHEISPEPGKREIDLLLSSGERVSCSLLAMAIQKLGYKAASFTGRQVGILTDSAHTKARIKKIEAHKINRALKEGLIVIVAGFQGIDENENVTTLGRGGSDTSAVALASALNADLCEIYSDVEGVFTTDPNIEPDARKLNKVSYEEMMEMASCGAKILEIRAVQFAKKYNVPVYVKSSFKKGDGTLVTKEDSKMEEIEVSGITYDKDQAKVSIIGVPDKPGIASKIFNVVADANIVIDMIIQNISNEGLTDISFTVPKNDAKSGLELAKDVGKEIGAKDVKIDKNMSKISIVGAGMRSHSGIAAKMFKVLAKENVNILMISTSEIKISCVIANKYTELAVRVLHKAFGLGKGK